MKITKRPIEPVVPPPSVYVLELSIEELAALRTISVFGSTTLKAIETHIETCGGKNTYPATGGTLDGPTLRRVMNNLWTHTNDHCNDIAAYVRQHEVGR